MRLRSVLPLVASVVALAAVPSSASAAATRKCPVKDHLFASYQVQRGPSSAVSCGSAFAVLYKGILDQKPPKGWRCRDTAERAWPQVETCELRRDGRRVAVASLFATDDFFSIP
ncbi:hypothetical protein [Patulibacter minatonensis]|uniref:hypothetical protein n=1 Tax=Patulibacter minatonensis TaxID=298163 RepID=UPI00047BCBCD|nr:hypothetical protein [Patulibacter minatonensis]